MFVSKPFKDSGIKFHNILTETDSLNYFTYSYLYMGGGVAVGDINNDGLQDLYFTGNMVQNKLYLNKGNLKFEDITEKAGAAGDQRWFTGVTMVDVNNDGYVDIYASVSGIQKNKKNVLYINNQDNTFSEQAEKYGLANAGNSVQSTFFDYDNDGDLDVYVANYPPTSFSSPNNFYRFKMANVKDIESDKLYKNEGGKFVDVSKEAGITSFGLSLSATAADLNNDGWKDIYVSNDFATPDYLYINNQDGTFTEQVKQATKQTCYYGMGVDIADFNNDNLLDILQVDMSAHNNRRSKANMASMNPRQFWSTVYSGFHYQYMQNSLQLNNGLVQSNTKIPDFSNVSRLAGMSSTDWSWGPLFADFDNDGWKDVFITNGTRKEINNRDYFKKLDKSRNKRDSLLYKSSKIPSEKIDNFIFKNNKDLTFSKSNDDWGLSYEGFSNGCVYADLDNDGDLDIVVNNIDDYASVFENKNTNNNNFLSVDLSNFVNNKFGVGARVEVVSGGIKQLQELTQTRGFQSSVGSTIHFGLGKNQIIDTIKITWPNGKLQLLTDVAVNQNLKISYVENKTSEALLNQVVSEKLFDSFFKDTIINHVHKENRFDDFKKQVLLPHKLSNQGPALAVADVNNDGLEDLFIGGAKQQSASLYVQTKSGFKESNSELWLLEKDFEDVKALFVDVDNDKDQDLYLVSGGYEFLPDSELLKDRLYVNDGKGNFSKSENILPNLKSSGSVVKPADYDKDGDVDLFVGGRLIPENYPLPGKSFILENKDHTFNEVTTIAQGLTEIGMVTDAEWIDIDGDSWLDLIVVGEWMTIEVFKNNKGTFSRATSQFGLENYHGWWNTVKAADFDNDGDIDFVAGNLGLNYKYQASEDETFDIYVNDFDLNKKTDIVLSYYNEGKQYPVRGRECSSQQIPTIKRKFKNYDSYSKATLLDLSLIHI